MAIEQSTIAIVEDDLEMREAIAELLSIHGYRTEQFASAEAFLSVAGSSRATCLLIDIHLGDITGVELGRHLSANGLKFPIIFMTGSQDATVRQQAMDFGCIAFLRKPFPTKQLLEAISKARKANPDQH